MIIAETISHHPPNDRRAPGAGGPHRPITAVPHGSIPAGPSAANLP